MEDKQCLVESESPLIRKNENDIGRDGFTGLGIGNKILSGARVKHRQSKIPAYEIATYLGIGANVTAITAEAILTIQIGTFTSLITTE